MQQAIRRSVLAFLLVALPLAGALAWGKSPESSQTTAGSAGIEEPTKMEDPATGWQTGHLAFRLQPLRYVLEDVNRYAQKPIVLGSDDVGTLVITGTVERENIAGWVKSLERAFNLQASEDADQIILRPR